MYLLLKQKGTSFLDEASADNKFILTTRIRAIGNSKGVILNNQFISSAGLNPDEEVNIIAQKGMIIITQAKSSVINTDLSTWDANLNQL
jgi:antitoxin component of MazEF toxin-antitoxin module